MPNLDFVGSDTFTFRVTDKAGASTVGTATGSTYALIPDPVSGFRATQADRINAVDLNWFSALNANSYQIYRSTNQDDPSPVLLDTVGGLSYTDQTARSGERFYYFIQAKNQFMSGAMSTGLLGFADTPPSNVQATFATLESQPELIVPTFIDTDPAEAFTVNILTAPSHGSTQVVGSQIRYTPMAGYIGNDTFQFSIVDRAGAATSAWATGKVDPGIPDAPLALKATQGTIVGSVKLDWQAMPGSLQYIVNRADAAAPSLTRVIATIDVNAFSDTNVTPGAKYFYQISGVGVAGNSPPTQQVSGYSDTPPISTSATATTIFNTPVEFTPVVVDPDPLESHLVTIDSLPANGAVVVNSNQRGFVYSPNPGWAGHDTFNFTVQDAAGATVGGVADVAVGCPAPTVGSLNLSQIKLFAGSGFKVSGSFGNTGCPATLQADLKVFSGTTAVVTSTQTGIAGAVSGSIEFPVDSLQAGSYVIKLSVTDTITNNVATSTLPLVVAGYRMPSFTATNSVFANLDLATIAVGSSPDCTITTDRSAALADHRICFYEVTPMPAGLAPVAGATYPTWNGKATTPGVYTPTLSVYQYDDFGAPKLLGSTVRTMTVLPVTSMAFASPTSVNVTQYMQEGLVSVTQTSGLPCQITTNRALAISNSAIGTRMCFLEFAQVSPYQVLTANGIHSPFFLAGTNSVNWTMSAIDVAGNQIPFTSGSTDVNVVPPDVSFSPTAGSTIPIATVTQANVRLNSTGSVTCSTTVNPAKANVAASDRPCLIEWTVVPEGLAQSSSTDLPLLEGVFKGSGAIPLAFDVSYYDVSGVKRLLFQAMSPIDVAAPPMPEIVLKSGRVVGTDIYAVPVIGGQVATLIVDTSKWPVDAAVKWSDEQVERTYRISPTRGSQIIPVTAAPLWTRRQAVIRLYLRDSPSLFVEKTVTVVSVPVSNILFDLDILPTTVADNAPAQLTTHISTRTNAGPLYDMQTMGQWSVQFGTKASTGAFVPEGAPVTTDSNGSATAGINPFGQTLIRALAVATPITPFDDVTLTSLTSQTRMSSVVKGTPIEGKILIKGLSEGPAPLIGIFRVEFTTRSDQLANQVVTWAISSDNGATYTTLDATGLQIVQRFNEGKYLVKASFKNRNTETVSESSPVAISVWDIPKIKITGPQFAFPSTPTHLDVTLTQSNGIPVQSGAVEWSVSRRVILAAGESAPPPLATGNTSSVDFNTQDPGMYLVTVRARMNSANPDNVRAWSTAQYQITYGAPEKPSDTIQGPIRAEVGSPYSFSVLTRTRFALEASSLKLAGQWTLPDGRVVPTLDPVSYTPTDEDLAKGSFINIKHEVWVVGYESSTTTVATKSIPIWKYVWPEWKIITSVTTPVAPTTARFSVLPNNTALLPTLDGLAYTWTVPSTMRTVSKPGSRLDVIADFGGSSTVSVNISDARGNSSTLDSTITIGDADPYVMNIKYSNQSKWTHAPLQIGLNPVVSGGHPLDRIIDWQYFLNGTKLDLPNKNIVSVKLNDPGNYDVEVRASSQMGATVSKTLAIAVPANQAPLCAPTAALTSNKLMAVIQSGCQDADGAITKYEWSVNGVFQPFATGSKWTYVLPAGVKLPVQVDLVVTDDAGARTTASATIN